MATSVPAIARRVAKDPRNRFGSDLVFLAPIIDAMDLPRSDAVDVLLALHRNGRIKLQRADLVGAMDASMVERSEIASRIGTWTGAVFHFYVL